MLPRPPHSTPLATPFTCEPLFRSDVLCVRPHPAGEAARRYANASAKASCAAARLTQIAPLPVQKWGTHCGEQPMTAEPAAPKEWDRSEGARRDIVAGGIVVAAILLFVGTGGAMMQSIVRALSGFGGGTDRVLAATLKIGRAQV